ncbi:MAG: competence protein ComEC family protein [Candidatus Pacebacteria bacterium]|nr:competence protein ComEC family protein [Candidatus Paceibacterota bacterium]
MQSIYVYAIILSFALGIAWQSILKQGTAFVVFLLILGLTISIIALLIQVNKTARQGLAVKNTVVLVIIIFAFAFGIVRTQLAQESSDTSLQALKSYQNEQVEIKGRVVKEPDKREYSTNLVVQSLSIQDTKYLGVQPLNILVKASAHQEFSYGDRVLVDGKLERVQNFISEDTGKEFDYVGYLAKDNIHYLIKRAGVSAVESDPNLSLKGALFGLKSKYLSVLEQNIPEPESALAGGITVGSKQSLGKELLEKFRKTGVIHIVVLSGFNVAIIAVFLTYIFSFAGPRVGRGLAAAGIILFALLTGGGATVVRASAMGLLALMALTVRRKYVVLRALFIVGFIMLLINPLTLLHDISFQLSFVATLGMILGMPIVESKLQFITTKGKLREIISATIATQIAVSPLLLYYMGEISMVAILANALVLPMVSVSMLVVFLTGAFGMIAGILSLPFAYASYALLHSIIFIVEVLARVPFTTFNMPGFNLWLVILAYTTMGILIWLAKPTVNNTPIYI